MGEVIGNAQQRLKPGCCLQLYVITVLEKEETLLNCTPCAPGNLNYCLCCTAVSDQLCGSWDFALFGRTLPPPDGYFSVILQRRTLFWVPFSIFLSLKKNTEHVYFAEQILCRSRLHPVHEDDSVPAVQVCGVRTCQRCLRMCCSREPRFPHRHLC